MRAVTVSSCLPDEAAHEDAYSALWDTHLVCDTHATPSPNTARLPLGEADPAAVRSQIVMAGLCAVGGWNDASSGYEISDFQDGGLKPLRFCHASWRAVYSTHINKSERSRFIPHTPPWPVPQGAGCETASSGSVPPWETVNQAADMLQLRCRKPLEYSKKRRRTFHLWRKLPLPTAQTQEERALRVFLSRIGLSALEPSSDKRNGSVSGQVSQQYCYEAMENQGLEQIAEHLERSGWNLSDGAAEANKPTPEAWTGLYRLCLSLVDGGAMPDGIERPLGANNSRLIWAETQAIVPEEADSTADATEDAATEDAATEDAATEDAATEDTDPPDSPPPTAKESVFVLSDSDDPSNEGLQDVIDDSEDRSDPQDPTADEDQGRWARDPVEAGWVWVNADGTRSHWRHSGGVTYNQDTRLSPSDPSPAQPKTYPSRADAKDTSKIADAARLATELWGDTKTDEMLEGKVKMGGKDDSLIRRLDQIRTNAVQEVQEKFCHHAFVYSDERERYGAAKQAQRKARRVGKLMLLLGFCGGLFTVDQRWPFFNELWQQTIGGNAPLRLYDPALLPLVPLAVTAGVVLLGSLYLFRSWRIFNRSAAKLEQANRNRQVNNTSLLHYVTELIRIRTLTRQFTDHQNVIALLLHRPFGHVEPPTEIAPPDLPWLTGVALPPGMLVGAAVPSDEITEADQRRLKQVFRANWLNELLHHSRQVWSKRYEDRIVSGFEWPERDTSPLGTIKHRDRQTGEPLAASRGDWLDFASGGERDTLSVTARTWLDRRMEQASHDSANPYASFLGRVEPYSEHIGWWGNALDLLGGTITTHDFNWGAFITSDAPTPDYFVLLSEPLNMASCLNDQLMVIFQWELVITDPVAPQNLPSWSRPSLTVSEPESSQEELV